jgi:hypothetical protein
VSYPRGSTKREETTFKTFLTDKKRLLFLTLQRVGMAGDDFLIKHPALKISDVLFSGGRCWRIYMASMLLRCMLKRQISTRQLDFIT